MLNAPPLLNTPRAHPPLESAERSRGSGEGLKVILQRAWLSALGALLLTFVVGGAIASAGRGPWVDEFWTLWQAQHDLSFAEVFRQRWLNDFHPPLFSVMHWLATPWIGDSMWTHRMLNVVPLGFAIVFAVVCARRYPRSFDVVALYAVLLLSFPVAFQYFAETRSYFWQACVVYMLVGGFVVIGDAADDLDWNRDKPMALLLLANVALAFNLHYFASLLTGIVVLGFAVLCWRRGQRRWAKALMATAALACVPLVVFVAVQSQFLAEESTHYWATGGAREAFDLISGATQSAISANIIGTAAAGLVLLLCAVHSVRRRTDGLLSRYVGAFAPSRQRTETLLLLVAGLLVFSLCLLALQSRQPIVVTRYLISLQAVIVGVCAILAAPLIGRWRTLAWVLVVFAIASTALVARRTEREARWDATAKAAAAAAQTCASAQVHGVLLDKRQSSRNFRPVLGWAYERYGQQWGFRAKPLPVGQSPSIDSTCPLILWLEHITPAEIQLAVDDPVSVLSGLGIDTGILDVTRARTVTGRSGFVMTVPQRGVASPI